MTTLPDNTYLVLVDFGKSGRSLLETDLADCGIDTAIEAISEHADMARDLSVVDTVYMVEAGKLFDVSEQVASAWLKAEGADWFEKVGSWPAFITKHGSTADMVMLQLEADAPAERSDYAEHNTLYHAAQF